MIRPANELTSGMVVANDVEARGTVLLKAGTVLTDIHIQRLKRWNIPSINTIEEDDAPATDDTETATKQELLAVRQELINDLFSPYKDQPDMNTLQNCMIAMLEDKYAN